MLHGVDVGPWSVEWYCRGAGDEAVARTREATISCVARASWAWTAPLSALRCSWVRLNARRSGQISGQTLRTPRPNSPQGGPIDAAASHAACALLKVSTRPCAFARTFASSRSDSPRIVTVITLSEQQAPDLDAVDLGQGDRVDELLDGPADAEPDR